MAFSPHYKLYLQGGSFLHPTGRVSNDCARHVEELMEAIRAVYNGHKYLSPQLIDPVIEDYVQHLIDHDDSSTLTPSKQEVLRLIAKGKSTAETADLRNVSPRTISTQRQHLLA